MIVIEFLIFVISSGLFCSERFRGNLYAVLIAGGVATGSSLLFMYHLGIMALPGTSTAPPVKVVKQVVRVPVLQKISQAPALSQPEDCQQHYPFLSRVFGQEGITQLAFHILADGRVNGVTVSKSSGSERLDDAAVDCVKRWHYRPAIKDGQLVETPWSTTVDWALGDGKDDKAPGEQPKDSAAAVAPSAPK